jgi:sirohydrochlorin cobaltochelatase
MPHPIACLFLAHGSRDPRTTKALNQLVQDCQNKLPKTVQLVGTAYLELAELPIVDQIILFANQAKQQNCQQVKILPLFLAPGVHVLDDLPVAVNTAQISLADRCHLELLTYLGAHPGLIKVLQYHRQQLPAPQILLAHGSQQLAAQQFLTNLATNLEALPAYWSGFPQLSDQIAIIATAQPTTIGIVPYFLFPGRISTALTLAVNELQSLFPNIQLQFRQGDLESSLLHRDPQLVDLLVTMILESP